MKKALGMEVLRNVNDAWTNEVALAPIDADRGCRQRTALGEPVTAISSPQSATTA